MRWKNGEVRTTFGCSDMSNNPSSPVESPAQMVSRLKELQTSISQLYQDLGRVVGETGENIGETINTNQRALLEELSHQSGLLVSVDQQVRQFGDVVTQLLNRSNEITKQEVTSLNTTLEQNSNSILEALERQTRAQTSELESLQLQYKKQVTSYTTQVIQSFAEQTQEVANQTQRQTTQLLATLEQSQTLLKYVREELSTSGRQMDAKLTQHLGILRQDNHALAGNQKTHFEKIGRLLTKIIDQLDHSVKESSDTLLQGVKVAQQTLANLVEKQGKELLTHVNKGILELQGKVESIPPQLKTLMEVVADIGQTQGNHLVHLSNQLNALTSLTKQLPSNDNLQQVVGSIEGSQADQLRSLSRRFSEVEASMEELIQLQERNNELSRELVITLKNGERNQSADDVSDLLNMVTEIHQMVKQQAINPFAAFQALASSQQVMMPPAPQTAFSNPTSNSENGMVLGRTSRMTKDPQAKVQTAKVGSSTVKITLPKGDEEDEKTTLSEMEQLLEESLDIISGIERRRGPNPKDHDSPPQSSQPTRPPQHQFSNADEAEDGGGVDAEDLKLLIENAFTASSGLPDLVKVKVDKSVVALRNFQRFVEKTFADENYQLFLRSVFKTLVVMAEVHYYIHYKREKIPKTFTTVELGDAILQKGVRFDLRLMDRVGQLLDQLESIGDLDMDVSELRRIKDKVQIQTTLFSKQTGIKLD